jgi:hypothetical protein
MLCSKCGAQNNNDAKFCKTCGEKINEDKSESVNNKPDIPNDKPISEADSTMDSSQNNVVIHSYDKGFGLRSPKIKILNNGQSVGEIGKNETVVVPITADSNFKFVVGMGWAGWAPFEYQAKSGKNYELKLKVCYTLSGGQMKIYDLNSPNVEEMIKQDEEKSRFPFVVWRLIFPFTVALVAGGAAWFAWD